MNTRTFGSSRKCISRGDGHSMKAEKWFCQRMLLSDKEVVFESKLLEKYHPIICTDKHPFDALFHGNYGRESREGGYQNEWLPSISQKEGSFDRRESGDLFSFSLDCFHLQNATPTVHSACLPYLSLGVPVVPIFRMKDSGGWKSDLFTDHAVVFVGQN